MPDRDCFTGEGLLPCKDWLVQSFVSGGGQLVQEMAVRKDGETYSVGWPRPEGDKDGGGFFRPLSSVGEETGLDFAAIFNIAADGLGENRLLCGLDDPSVTALQYFYQSWVDAVPVYQHYIEEIEEASRAGRTVNGLYEQWESAEVSFEGLMRDVWAVMSGNEDRTGRPVTLSHG